MVSAKPLHIKICVDGRFLPMVNMSARLPNDKWIIHSRNPFHLPQGKQVQRAPNIFPTNQINCIILYYMDLYIWYYIVSSMLYYMVLYCIRSFLPLLLNNNRARHAGKLSFQLPPPPSPTFVVFVYVSNVSWCHASMKSRSSFREQKKNMGILGICQFGINSYINQLKIQSNWYPWLKLCETIKSNEFLVSKPRCCTCVVTCERRRSAFSLLSWALSMTSFLATRSQVSVIINDIIYDIMYHQWYHIWYFLPFFLGGEKAESQSIFQKVVCTYVTQCQT